MSDIISHYVERPDCKHMQVIMARASDSAVDYQQRLIPELKEAIKEPCEQCIKAKAEIAKQKLVQKNARESEK